MSKTEKDLNQILKCNSAFNDEVLPEILAENMKEIKENPETLEEDIKEFRKRILEDTELYANLDDEFLLRFLRARKFDKQRALTLIQDYYKIRHKHRTLFENAKPSLLRYAYEDNIQNFLPQRDHLGRRVAIARVAYWNPDRFKAEIVILSVLVGLEKLAQEKETQLCGFCGILDAKDFTFYQARNLSIFDIKNAVVLLLKYFPLRMKELHFVNESPLLRPFLALVRALVTKKIRDRIFIHGDDYSNLHKHIPVAILPEEYGGDQPPMDNRPCFQSLLDSEEYFEHLLTFGYGKKSPNKPDEF